MARYLLDSVIVIDHFNGVEAATEFLAAHGRDLRDFRHYPCGDAGWIPCGIGALGPRVIRHVCDATRNRGSRI